VKCESAASSLVALFYVGPDLLAEGTVRLTP